MEDACAGSVVFRAGPCLIVLSISKVNSVQMIGGSGTYAGAAKNDSVRKFGQNKYGRRW